jgi:hypothetical protein
MSSYGWNRLEMEAHRRRSGSKALPSISLSVKELFQNDVREKATR